MCLCRYMCHKIHVEVRGALCGVDSVLLHLSESSGLRNRTQFFRIVKQVLSQLKNLISPVFYL